MKNIAFSILNNLSSLRNSIKGYAILMYHKISENSSVLLPDSMTLDIESFTRQMNYLRNECTPISISDIVSKIHSNTSRREAAETERLELESRREALEGGR